MSRSATCGRASPSWRSTCCATARCGTGRSGGTSTWKVPLGDSSADAAVDHDTYRQVMFLVGSLFRRLAPGDGARVRVDEDRERYMWTRMREHLDATGTDPADCLYVCGAFRAASRVEEFGVRGRRGSFTISPRTATSWRYGLIPSSHAAIEAQFGLAAGSVSIAAAEWAKSLKRTRSSRTGWRARPGRRSPVRGSRPRRRRRLLPSHRPGIRPPPTGSPASCAGRPYWTRWTRRSCSAGRLTSCARPGAAAISPPPPTPSRSSRRRACWPGCGTGPSPRRTTSRTRRSPASRRTWCRGGGTCGAWSRS
ncbi:hypothetical protein STENM327S_05207 [Streptomyces tendae]